MGRRLAAATVAVATLAAGTAWAADQKCAKPEEMTAMQTAAVQQELMVAALTCNAVTLYNAFVTGYQKELFASDKALQKLYMRMRGGKSGMEGYHAYKTKLANGSSMKSIRNITEFCANAQAAFSTALGPAKSTLSAFISGKQNDDNDDNDGITACEYKQDTMAAMKAVPHVELKKPEALKKKKAKTSAAAETVVPAQGGTETATP